MTETDPLDRHDEERYLVGLLLPVTLRSLRDEALSRVQSDDFGTAAYGGVWEAALAVRAADKPIDRRSLIAQASILAAAEPGSSPKLIRIREQYTSQVLDGLDGYLPTPAEFPRALADVTTAGKLRRLVVALDRAKQRAFTAEDFGDAYSITLSEIESLGAHDEDDDGAVTLGEVIARLEQRFKDPASGEKVIPSPWPEFNDKAAGGLHRGRLHVIGARPGEGKSIAAHQAATHASVHGLRSLVFSMEMDADEVGGRVLSSQARIDMGEVARYELASDDSWRRYYEFRDRAHGIPLMVIDHSGMTVDRIISRARVQKRRHGLDVLVVDYLQLLNLRGATSREQQVSEIARRFKLLARELDCAVVLPAQLNRETERRGKPSLADLRESGGIEAHADLVMLLARLKFPDNHPDAPGQYNGMILMAIAKNRFGSTGELELPWRGCYASIG